MPWIKVSDNPPDYRGWLKCDTCGWMALRTQGNIKALGEGQPCKYCSHSLRAATESDMQAAYPDGTYDWRDELPSIYVLVHFRQDGEFSNLPAGDEDILVWIKTFPFAIIASWDPDTEEGINIFRGGDYTISFDQIIAWAPLAALSEYVKEETKQSSNTEISS